MEKFSVVSLFPTAVANFTYAKGFTKTELNFVEKIERYRNQGNFRSVDSYVLNNPKMKNISKYLQTCTHEYFKQVFKPVTGIEIYITQSWFNFTDKGQYHHKHGHPNSYISGVFYINAVENKDSITFHLDDDFKRLQVQYSEWNPYNSNSWTMPAKSGVLYLFPSHLQHSVQFVQSEEERISLAFNTYLKGKLGNELSLTELILE